MIQMKGKPKVIAALNEALKEELTAINQYFLHAEMCENWHYKKLGDHIRKESIAEMKHAESLIERILFLDGTPNLTEPMQLTVGSDVQAQIQSDLNLEIAAVAMYNRLVNLAREEGDNASRELFERLLRDEEGHVDWLEAQVHQIKEMGYERYLSQQIFEKVRVNRGSSRPAPDAGLFSQRRTVWAKNSRRGLWPSPNRARLSYGSPATFCSPPEAPVPTPARRAFESPIAMACCLLRTPCFPSSTWRISSRTNSPA